MGKEREGARGRKIQYWSQKPGLQSETQGVGCRGHRQKGKDGEGGMGREEGGTGGEIVIVRLTMQLKVRLAGRIN